MPDDMNYPEGISKMDDYNGRRGHLTRRIQSVGGDRIEPGEAVKIEGHYRGRLKLRTLSGKPRYITGVDRNAVTLLAEEPAA